jgi:hypothetical protein
MAKTKKNKKSEMYDTDDLLYKKETAVEYMRHKKNKRIKNAIKSKDLNYLIDLEDFE